MNKKSLKFWKKVFENRKKLSVGLLLFVGLLAVTWGFVESHYTVRVLDRANVLRDNGVPVAQRLKELSGDSQEAFQKTMLSFSNIHNDDSPTLAPPNVLWSRHQHVFAGLTWQENKERYYRYMYYQNLDGKWLASTLRKGDFVTSIALFGWGRHTNRLSFDSKPLTLDEILQEARNYQRFYNNFSIKEASSPKLDYLVFPKDREIDLKNIDKWYERSEAEQHGIYSLYQLKLRRPE